MENKMEFVNSKHIDNYLGLLKQFPKEREYDFDIALKLLSIEEVYCITKDYINEMGINFKELLKDSRIAKNGLFICELAYSLVSKFFQVKSISSTRKLDSDTRNFIIDLLYMYNPIENKVNGL
ncbi:hypothetical protein H7E67_06750 [Clostridium gasigenes]|uniref:Uncharacterized protein n=1 Tax=Clostridium gasigenes TaxID=94869 RepID=A0A7X0SF81_9CLOT|nr:hypothetical protein [Clostridium gasigenes]MBB6623120.1 hypothetical protein [Clostridium gasigenes]MBB6715253.1 hypothetical protein [Clostridium gasigenes]